ncbi:type I-E CRISPR-associated protein Cas6/Cse3/CasE [Pararhizobium sp. BT-229]|uniref:type I-E CRISPR-associated protein Cas6/Cse3/CasE n=1 Tax=Pararhizobium sp. BT-229 TaxID=2986923 RepID=UPI0021F7BCFD|nr:type I-E CRISPR-associated protein Cas6/Cse3/CasE [Pararhizobium sp. BT-229]MCV9964290.1 type I-E CRISPR-associated protein Cas6/Cse3/CasE [Pararhizobium sp. BT-229]
MRDFIFKPRLDEKGDVDRTRLKKEIAGILGDRVVDGRARYLFSAEPLVGVAGEWFRLRMTGEGVVPGMVEIPLTECVNGDEVVLSAWIALDSNMFRIGEPRTSLAGRCREKLLRLCHSRFGAAMDTIVITVDSGIRVMSARSKGSNLTRPYGHVNVAGIVTDSARIREIQQGGIGEARAYGFGLVAAKPIPQGTTK